MNLRGAACSNCGRAVEETPRIVIRVSEERALILCSRDCTERAFDDEAHNWPRDGYRYYDAENVEDRR